VLKAPLERYRIVHFATHAVIDDRHPELAGVLLSFLRSDGSPQDGFLRLHDIYALRLAADLVVLSACQTAVGPEVRGEGMVGLVRGFMSAGAARVVASLWKVDDAATAALMTEVYTALLRDGLAASAPLRRAQMHLWQHPRWQAPFYWGAFQLQGEWR
jgi:CHAT domain-containing protein